ncbi:MAG TPA: glycoside hydrolase family 88 protein, partial [Draconibacterium sp.]|nr:glycoside hydrolase family 88 protein [Draconibacterium sp.]
MRNILLNFVTIAAILLSHSCSNKPREVKSGFVDENVKFADEQYDLQIAKILESGEILNPKSFIDGKMKYINPQEWTSGFFPGSLWYLYELSGDEKWKNRAAKFTETLDTVQYLTNHHDVGFMIGCSYGNGYRLMQNEPYKQVIIQAARSLSTRFRPVAGIIQSWDVTSGWQAERGWECPVIIDNMMNLELLFEATKLSGDSTFWKIALTHADNTIKNHFRPDFSTYHVIDYSLADGSVRN